MNHPAIPLFSIAVVCVLFAAPVAAQSSASHTLTEHGFDQGGNTSGAALVGATHQITMSSLGGPADGWSTIGSASHLAHGGFVTAYPPPLETLGLRFNSGQALVWNAEPSVGEYQLYRDTLPGLGGPFGNCLQGGLTQTSTTDSAAPAPGQIWGYLVTARNRIGEQGSAGNASGGAARVLAFDCPP